MGEPLFVARASSFLRFSRVEVFQPTDCHFYSFCASSSSVGSFSSVGYFRGFRSKIREDLFLSLTMIQRVGYIFFRALLLLILFRLRRRRAVEREMMLRGARVFINVAQQ